MVVIHFELVKHINLIISYYSLMYYAFSEFYYKRAVFVVLDINMTLVKILYLVHR
jgi:hypothetical protein